MNRKFGVVFWIEGFSGSGKTSISKNIQKDISKLFGPTLVLSGDILRKFFDKKGYSKKDRIKNSYKFSEMIKFLTEQKLNVVYSAVCLNNAARNIYKKNIKNFFQIYLKSDIKKIIKLRKKNTYKKKKNILGIHIRPEYPTKPDIVIENNFDKPLKKISNELVKKIKKKLKNKFL
tara:strand:+ start:234 stop:758 length:525 start_codon:yes stop_codon:yes gene_type:complete